MLGLNMQLESCNPNPFCTWLERAQGCFASLLSVIFPREGVSTGLPDSLQPECEQVSSGSKPSCPWASRRPGTRTVGDRLPEHTAWSWRPSHWGAAKAQAYWPSLGKNILSKLILMECRCPFVQQNNGTARQCSRTGVLEEQQCTPAKLKGQSVASASLLYYWWGQGDCRTGLIDLDCSLSSGSVWVVRLMQVTVWSTLPCLQLNCSVLVGDVVLSPCEICFSPTDWAFCAEVPDLTPISKFPSATQQNIWGKPFCVSVCVCVGMGVLHILLLQHCSHTQHDTHSTDGVWKHTGKTTKINHPL